MPVAIPYTESRANVTCHACGTDWVACPYAGLPIAVAAATVVGLLRRDPAPTDAQVTWTWTCTCGATPEAVTTIHWRWVPCRCQGRIQHPVQTGQAVYCPCCHGRGTHVVHAPEADTWTCPQ